MLLKKYKLGAKLEIIKEGERNISRLVNYQRIYDEEYKNSYCKFCPLKDDGCNITDGVTCGIYDTRYYSYIIIRNYVKKAR